MKNIITLLALVLVFMAAKAQQPSSTSQSTSSATTGTDKQCHGVTKDCPFPCTNDAKKCNSMSKKECASHHAAVKTSSFENMSAEHTNSGSVAVKSSTCCDKAQACCKQTKSCCNSTSKASALSSSLPSQSVSGEAPKK